MGLIGVPHFSLPFPLADVQAKWLVQVWLGNVQLPTKAEMEQTTEKREFGVGCYLNPRYFHKLGPEMFPYMEQLANEAAFEWDSRVMHTIFKDRFPEQP